MRRAASPARGEVRCGVVMCRVVLKEERGRRVRWRWQGGEVTLGWRATLANRICAPRLLRRKGGKNGAAGRGGGARDTRGEKHTGKRASAWGGAGCAHRFERTRVWRGGGGVGGASPVGAGKRGSHGRSQSAFPPRRAAAPSSAIRGRRPTQESAILGKGGQRRHLAAAPAATAEGRLHVQRGRACEEGCVERCGEKSMNRGA